MENTVKVIAKAVAEWQIENSKILGRCSINNIEHGFRACNNFDDENWNIVTPSLNEDTLQALGIKLDYSEIIVQLNKLWKKEEERKQLAEVSKRRLDYNSSPLHKLATLIPGSIVCPSLEDYLQAEFILYMYLSYKFSYKEKTYEVSIYRKDLKLKAYKNSKKIATLEKPETMAKRIFEDIKSWKKRVDWESEINNQRNDLQERIAELLGSNIEVVTKYVETRDRRADGKYYYEVKQYRITIGEASILFHAFVTPESPYPLFNVSEIKGNLTVKKMQKLLELLAE